jgi:peptidoglycan/LPS O-acetylase OafA/YrhL
MPAKGKVSIGWQIVFAIISPVNLWAFYRIKKLRLYALYVIVPSIIFSSIMIVGGFYEMNSPQKGFDDDGNRYPEPTLPPHMTPIEPQVGKFNTGTYMILNLVASVGLTILSVYLVVKWSRQWNEQFS